MTVWLRDAFVSSSSESHLSWLEPERASYDTIPGHKDLARALVTSSCNNAVVAAFLPYQGGR